jgi:hypothetical protein
MFITINPRTIYNYQKLGHRIGHLYGKNRRNTCGLSHRPDGQFLLRARFRCFPAVSDRETARAAVREQQFLGSAVSRFALNRSVHGTRTYIHAPIDLISIFLNPSSGCGSGPLLFPALIYCR